MSAPPPAAPPPSLARRLEWLIYNLPDPQTGRPFSKSSLAQRTGGRVSDSTIGRIADGSIDNPRIDTLYAIADAYQLPRTILLDDPQVTAIFELALAGDPRGREMILEMRALQAASDRGVYDFALRASSVARSNAHAARSLDAFLRLLEENKHLISPPDDD
ncbi:MAG TPA: helix-turn-helix domain-containing protein [Nonomuraea sp.]|nr:helix-turn-helix domain-containing protein [Nonomuraea sp.]